MKIPGSIVPWKSELPGFFSKIKETSVNCDPISGHDKLPTIKLFFELKPALQ
jgi:hypothetical protein